MKQDHGFLPIDIAPEDYVLGAYTKLPNIVLQPDGQWDNFLPVSELQERNGLETSNCTVYGTLNVLETLYKRLYGEERNYSERYIGVLAETTPRGNNVQKVIEIIRKEYGLIPEKLLPFDDTINEWDKYYSPKPMSREFILSGKNWLLRHKIGHEWIFGKNDRYKITRLKEALKYSPVGVSVLGWFKDSQGFYYKPKGANDNHYCMLCGYKDGKYWKIFDHYDDTRKRLRWNYDFNFAKRYTLEKIKITEPIKKQFGWNGLEICRIIKEKLLEIQRSLKKSLGKLFGKEYGSK